MKEKILINARIIDPSQKMDEIGNIIINDNGKIKSIGKKVKVSDASKTSDKIDLKGKMQFLIRKEERANSARTCLAGKVWSRPSLDI